MFGLLKKAMIWKGAVSEKGAIGLQFCLEPPVIGSSSALCGPGRKGWEKSPPLPLPALEPQLQFSEDGLVLRPAVVFYSISQSFFRIISHRWQGSFSFSRASSLIVQLPFKRLPPSLRPSRED